MTRNYQLITSKESRKSFTLIELLVVLALVAILSVVVILTLNPAELLKQARDSNRLSDLSTINTALNLFSADVTSGFMGTSTIVYVSIPSASPTCTGLGLPTLPAGYTYNCVASANLRNTNGTGWIPVNFQRISSNSPISQLPIDPINTTSTRLYYTYVSGGSWELNASIEASKNKLGGTGDVVSKDGGSAASLYEIGNNLHLNPVEIGDVGLVGYWNFEEGSGAAAYDRSGLGNDGVWNGTLGGQWTNGKVGSYAGSFNGADNSITVLDDSSLNFGVSNFSVSFWVKKNTEATQGSFISKNSSTDLPGWTFYQHGANMLALLISDGSVSYDAVYGPAINDNIWRHIVGVVNRSENTLYIYINGVQIQSAAITITGSVTNAYSLNMGSQWGSIHGLLDDLRLYNRALSAAEILALYNSTK